MHILDTAYCIHPRTGTINTEAGTEPGGFGPRVSTEAMATAGILLSDRTLMSHNHFKNSGVLNGFPKVRVLTRGYVAI